VSVGAVSFFTFENVTQSQTLSVVFVDPAVLDYDAWIGHYKLTKSDERYREWLIGVAPFSGDELIIAIEMDDGEPLFRWTPNLRSLRHYIIEGRASLTEGTWEDEASPTDIRDTSRYFRLRVELP